MREDTEKRWKELCMQAAVEQDSDRLMSLITELNLLVEQRQNSLKSARTNRSPLG